MGKGRRSVCYKFDLPSKYFKLLMSRLQGSNSLKCNLPYLYLLCRLNQERKVPLLAFPEDTRIRPSSLELFPKAPWQMCQLHSIYQQDK